MSRILVIHAPAGFNAPLPWGLFEEGVLVEAGRASLGEIAPQAEGAELWLAAPGADVTVRRVEMPAKAQGKARAMLPYLLEDDIATSLDDMHFCLGAADGEGRLATAMARPVMDGWLAALKEHGLAPARMAPDFLCLAPSTAVAAGGRVLVRFADGTGFALEDELAGQLLADSGEDAPKVQPLDDVALMSLLHAGLAEGAALSLLQGRYEVRPAFKADFRQWRRTGVIAGLAAASYLVMMLSQAWWYESQTEVMDRQGEALLRAVFPDIARVVNPRAQMQARLATLRAGASDRFLQLSGLLAASVQGVEGVEVRSLRYDDDKGELAAEMAYGDFQDMEAVKAAVTGRGGQMEEGGSRNSGERMIGDIRVRMP